MQVSFIAVLSKILIQRSTSTTRNALLAGIPNLSVSECFVLLIQFHLLLQYWNNHTTVNIFLCYQEFSCIYRRPPLFAALLTTKIPNRTDRVTFHQLEWLLRCRSPSSRVCNKKRERHSLSLCLFRCPLKNLHRFHLEEDSCLSLF